MRSLEQCVDFLKGLGIFGPYRWVAGLEGVLDRYRLEDNFRRKKGLCQVPIIEAEGFFKADDNAREVLEPFFEEVFDKCGLDRPAPVT